MNFEVLYKDEVTQIGKSTGRAEQIEITTLKEGEIYNIFPSGILTLEEQEEFLSDRIFPSSRQNAKDILKSMELDFYDSWAIIENTNGISSDDYLWIRFEGKENLTWEDVKIRR